MRTLAVGFSQRIKLSWLEHTARMVLAGAPDEQIGISLQDLLKNYLSIGGTAKRGTREKAITILTKIWVTVRSDLLPLRNDGLALLARLPVERHLAVHWGMTMAAYPFWYVVAESTGRLLRLQGNASAAQIQRRVREQLGERETVARAARRIIRSFVDWAVIRESTTKGVYVPSEPIVLEDSAVIAWLVEASLIAGGASSVPLKILSQSPALFPFRIDPHNSIEWLVQRRLEVHRHSLDEPVVSLAPNRLH
jgi:hypothetical protein